MGKNNGKTRIGKENLIDSLKKIVEDLNIEAPLKGGKPGKKWYSILKTAL